MSKIFDLINELCPDGVEFKELGEIADIVRGQRVTKAELQNDGKYPVVSGGIKPLGFLNKFNREANTITVAQYGTAGYINFIEEKFWANDVCYCIFPKKEISNKFLLYCLMKNQEFIYSLRTNAIPAHLPQKLLSEIKLPVPPIEVQREIVRILDCFTLLTAELTAELTARKKQYEFYRDRLLSFDELNKNGGGCELKMLGKIADYSSSRISFSALNELNYVSVENLLQDKAGKIPSKCVPSSGNWTKFEIGDILIGNIRPYLKKIWQADCTGGASGDVLVLRLNDESVNSRYLYQILADDKFFDYNMKNAKGAKMPRGNKNAILEYKIPIPSLPTQRKIVEILDKFDTLVNSIAEGLPCEIELRQKQYEYYREKLLNFTEIEKEI